MRSGPTRLIDHFLSRLPPGTVIFDLGAGGGEFAALFVSKGWSVVAVDVSQPPFRAAGLTWIEQDLTSNELPVEFESMAVFLRNICHLLPNRPSENLVGRFVSDPRCVGAFLQTLDCPGDTIGWSRNREAESAIRQNLNERYKKMTTFKRDGETYKQKTLIFGGDTLGHRSREIG